MRILALLVEASTVPACLDAAVAVAERLDEPVCIEAFHGIVDLAHAAGSSEEVALEQIRELREGTAFERARDVAASFADWLAGRPAGAPRIEWRETIGCEEEMVERESATASLLVLAAPGNPDGYHARHAALVRSGRPLLLVPGNWRRAAALGRSIAVACSDALAVRRAVGGALPWLSRAERVTIILVDEPATVAADLVALFAAEGIASVLHQVPRSHAPLGDQLIEEAHAIGADLLVMGAYRHAEPLEWLLGATTRHALRHADLPLLLAH